MKQHIAQQITKVLKGLGIEDVTVLVEYPADGKFGDYTTNVALVAAKKVGKNPRELAVSIVDGLEGREGGAGLDRVEVAGPGFINIWVKDEVLVEALATSPTSQDLRNDGVFARKKVMVEYTDPNPFKEFHIGHLYSNIVGESIARLLEANGAEVWRVDYFGDVGMHVAKSLWGIEEKFKDQNAKFKVMDDLEKVGLEERVKFMGEAYAMGATAYEENPEAAEVIRMINRHVYIAAQKMWQEEKGIEPKVDYYQGNKIDVATLNHILEVYKRGRKWSLEYFETIYERLGTKFNAYYPESIAGERGYQLVKEGQEKGVFVESDGAIVYPEYKSGLHTRVFINQLGLPTYEAKELGLAPWKYEEFPYDLSVIVTGNEINEYFRVLITALKEIKPELGEKAKHLSHGMVKLPEGKMSSRTGKIVTGEWLLDEAKSRALKLSDSEEIAEQVGIGAIKYALLKNGIGKDVEFSFDESVSFEGNSGPYLQYTYARTQSVLRKGEPADGKQLSLTNKLEPEERNVLRHLARFDEIVEEAALRYSPNIVATYLFELAQAFNHFYQKHAILKGSQEKLQFRLHLTSSVGEVLKLGLYLLGIKAPEKM